MVSLPLVRRDGPIASHVRLDPVARLHLPSLPRKVTPMANPNGRKGREWENACLLMLGRLWSYVYYAGKQGRVDKGDFVNTGKFCFEAKNRKKVELAKFMDEAKAEAVNAGVPYPVVLLKRRNYSPQQGYAVMEIGTFLQLLEDSGYGDDQ